MASPKDTAVQNQSSAHSDWHKHFQPAKLVLEDGRIFHGRRFGHHADIGGEVVFNTSMTGYQEILTDPSYAGELVTLTYPMIGNFGFTGDDAESAKAHLRALLVKEVSRVTSNWRAERTLPEYLKAQRVVGFCDFDTRALVRHIRTQGALRGIIVAEEIDIEAALEQCRALPPMQGQDLVQEVSCQKAYDWTAGPHTIETPDEAPAATFKVIALDFGIKRNILRRLVGVGCQVQVVPARTPAKEILAQQPDGVFLSNGPGDPSAVHYGIETIQELLGQVPLFGICLGHQLLALACGAKTYKLPFGHRGGNHPVLSKPGGVVSITSQNHGFAVDKDTLPDCLEPSFISLFDGTLEGVRHKQHPAFSAQFHPEAGPGPHDAHQLFEQFAQLMRTHRKS